VKENLINCPVGQDLVGFEDKHFIKPGPAGPVVHSGEGEKRNSEKREKGREIISGYSTILTTGIILHLRERITIITVPGCIMKKVHGIRSIKN
jgi:hypothetical protein